jgi:hypothetical protein
MQQEPVIAPRAIAFQIGITAWLAALCSLPLLRFGVALDAHWTIAWPALHALIFVGLVLKLITLSPRFFWVAAAVGVLIVGQQAVGKESYNEDILLLVSFLLLLSLQPTDKLRSSSTVRVILSLLWGFYTLLLLVLLVKNSLALGYSHESTYAIKPLFAHRNIAIEAYILWSIAAFALLGANRMRWLLLAAATGVIVVYQVRTALIGVALFGAFEIIRNFRRERWFKWCFAFGMVMLVAMQLTFSYLRAPAQKHRFDALPDLVKNLDLSYNLTRAESSSERLIMWKWTGERINLLGHGIGSWKFEAEGYIGAALGKCELMVRHPHADLLKLVFEAGIIFTFLFLAWWLVLIKPSLRYMVVFLPMLVFAFPTERGETLSALMILLLCTSKPQPVQKGLALLPALAVISALLMVSIGWSRSQHCLGKAMRDPIVLKTTSPADRKLLDAFPFDIVLNRLPTYQAIVLADAGQTQAACELLTGILSKHPNDQGALRLMQRLGGQLPANAVVCDSLTTTP